MARKKLGASCEGHIKADEAEKLSVEEVLQRLGTDPSRGLSEEEAQRRLQRLGYNEIPEEKPSPIKRFLSYFWGPIPWMIEAALVLSAIIHHWVDFWIILALLIVNAVVGFWEEHKAENILEYLKKKLAHTARVLRDGRWRVIESRLLVPGDIVKLRLGDMVPADVKIIEGNLLVDQSALTGESLPVEKKRGDVVYASSIVKRGEALGVVVATGLCTYFGKTVELVERARTVSEYQRLIIRIGDYLILLTIILVSAMAIYEIFVKHTDTLEVVRYALVLTVAAIPAALPAVLSITMAIGAYELAKKQAIVRKLVAVEELAGVDVLCADKTGTITLNKLTAGDPVALQGFTQREVVLYAALASREEDMDPIDLAVLDLARKMGLSGELRRYKQLVFKPFDPETKRTEALIEAPDGRRFWVTKGAPQVIAELVGDAEVAARVQRIVDEYAEKGYRMIGVGVKFDGGWRYVGLIPLFDPPRPDAKETIRALKEYGVRVKMITGDHTAIAKMIARMVGIGTNILPIRVLREAPPHEQRRLVEEADGFAEVLPEHKYMIVELLQQNGHHVAMTGDGVNDAPALKKANVGIAVANATDAARAAADIVLLAPGIRVIKDAIFTARKIFRRMYSYVVYRITETIRVLFFIVLCILLLNIYPITAVALILLALLNDLPILAIAYDNVRVSRRPEKWNIPRILAVSTALGLMGVVESFLLVYLAIYYFGFKPSTPEMLATLQTLIFLKLAVAGHLTIFVTRTEGPMWSVRPGNLLLWTAVGTKLLATLICVLGLGIVAPIPAWMAGFIWAYCLAWLPIEDGVKLLVYHMWRKPVFHRAF